MMPSPTSTAITTPAITPELTKIMSSRHIGNVYVYMRHINNIHIVMQTQTLHEIIAYIYMYIRELVDSPCRDGADMYIKP